MPRKHRGDGHGLELEEREGGAVIRYTDKRECRVGDVEDVLVEVVELGAIGDEDGGRCRGFADGHAVVVQVGEEGHGAVVACADDYLVDGGQEGAVFQVDGERDWLVIW